MKQRCIMISNNSKNLGQFDVQDRIDIREQIKQLIVQRESYPQKEILVDLLGSSNNIFNQEQHQKRMSSVRNILTQSQSSNSSSFCLFKRVSWVVVWLFKGGVERQEEEILSNEKISSVNLGKIRSDTEDRIDQKLTISTCSTTTLSQIQNNESADFMQASCEGLVHALHLPSTGYDLDDFITQRSLYDSQYGDDKISTDSGDQIDIEVDCLEEE